MTEPHIVDLRRSPDDRDPGATSGSGASRRNTLAGVALLVLGGLAGWLLAQPTNQAEPEASPAPTPVVNDVVDGPASEVVPNPVTPEVDTEQEGSGEGASQIGDRPRFLEANVAVLDGVEQLAGPVTLLPGIEASTQIRLRPDGTIGVVLEPSGQEVAPAFGGQFLGYPLGELNGGTLYSPLDQAMGAVAYWSREGGVSLPLPNARTTTSFLAGAGDLGVFRSGESVVVRHMEDRVNLLTVPDQLDGQPVVHACLHPSGNAIALVAASGTVLVLQIESGSEIARLQTSTPLFGVAWSGPRQMVHLVEDSGSQLLVVNNFETATVHETAMLEGGAGWKLTTEGTGC